jgi:hypothetical protein
MVCEFADLCQKNRMEAYMKESSRVTKESASTKQYNPPSLIVLGNAESIQGGNSGSQWDSASSYNYYYNP